MDEQNVTPELTAEEEYEQAFAELTGVAEPVAEVEADTQADIITDNPDTDVPVDEVTPTDSDVPQADIQADNSEADTPDIWANVSDEQRVALEELQQEKSNWQHRFQSDAGRVSALQRKINDLEAALSTPQQAVAPQAQPVDPIQSPEMDSFKEDYPDIAEAVDRMVQQQLAQERQQFAGAINQLDSRISQTIKPIQENEHQRFVDTQMQALEAQHPDWREVASSADFLDWIGHQPDTVQSMYNSESASDAAYLVGSFKQVYQQAPQAEPVAPQTQPELAQAVSPRSRRTAPVTNTVPDDYEAAWDYWVNKG